MKELFSCFKVASISRLVSSSRDTFIVSFLQLAIIYWVKQEIKEPCWTWKIVDYLLGFGPLIIKGWFHIWEKSWEPKSWGWIMKVLPIGDIYPTSFNCSMNRRTDQVNSPHNNPLALSSGWPFLAPVEPVHFIILLCHWASMHYVWIKLSHTQTCNLA
jgi:hypothetical protein